MSATIAESLPRNVAELMDRVGNVPPERVLLQPQPGTATVDDVVRLAHSANKQLCELIDGVLVEKTMGFLESQLAGILAQLLNNFVRPRRLGIVTTTDGTVQILPDQIRIPDVAFYRRESLPEGKTPTEDAPAIVPELAIELISPSNTSAEMARKRHDYFAAGVRLVWEIDGRARNAVVWTAVDAATRLTEADSLDGADVLPGLTVKLAELFADLDQ